LNRLQEKNKGILFIVSAPSGAGKTTLCKMAVDYFADLRHSVSYTTRPPRDNERDGIDYHFVSRNVFQKMIDRGEFLEWAEVHGNRYGTSLNGVEALLKEGFDIILDIDFQGAKQIKNHPTIRRSAAFVFILPPSLKISEKRIIERGKDTQAIITKRLEAAKIEIQESMWYDYVIINDSLEDAFERLKSIVIAERSRGNRMVGQAKQIYQEVLD
jgi:guanylate kinase